MKKIHSGPLVSAPRMIFFLDECLEWFQCLKLTHPKCFAHANISQIV